MNEAIRMYKLRPGFIHFGVDNQGVEPGTIVPLTDAQFRAFSDRFELTSYPVPNDVSTRKSTYTTFSSLVGDSVSIATFLSDNNVDMVNGIVDMMTDPTELRQLRMEEINGQTRREVLLSVERRLVGIGAQ